MGLFTWLLFWVGLLPGQPLTAAAWGVGLAWGLITIPAHLCARTHPLGLASAVFSEPGPHCLLVWILLVGVWWVKFSFTARYLSGARETAWFEAD